MPLDRSLALPEAAAFDIYLQSFVQTKVLENEIVQNGCVNGTSFSLTVLLEKWSGKTTPHQIVTATRLFWQCYPKMYARFGQAGQSPREVRLAIEDEGYEIAWACGNLVHLHDGWLCTHPDDFDCLTHEFAHVIQNGWDDLYLEYSDYIERFADCCRYLYAFENGRYNDGHWQLQTIGHEPTRKRSVRFLVWLDHFYSTKEKDLLLTYFDVCRNDRCPSGDWKRAWKKIVSRTDLDGKDIEEIWKMYENSEFATLSSLGRDTESDLLTKYPLRK